MGNSELRPLDARPALHQTALATMAGSLLVIACTGPTREYYEPEEQSAEGGASSNGGATSTSGTTSTSGATGTAGSTVAPQVGGAAGSATASAGGNVGTSGASNAQGGQAASGASGIGGAIGTSGAASLGGATGTSGATGSGGSISVGGALVVAGSPSAGGVTAAGGTMATGGTVANSGASGQVGVGGGSAGKQLGTTCSLNAECASLSCLDGVCCSVTACPECTNCGTAGLCSIAVKSAQDPTGNVCSGIRTCDAAGTCRGSKTAGQPCTAPAECYDGFCADGVCCKTACNGMCQTCDTAGNCQATVMREDDSCRTDAKGTRMCDAKSFCSMPHLISDVNKNEYTVAGITNTSPSYPRGFTQGPDRRVYFSASDGVAGEELWVTDGTATGTSLVADLVPNIGNSSPRGLVNAGNYLLFAAFNAGGSAQLFATNGIAAGTYMVKDFGNSAFVGNSFSARAAGNIIYFPACNAVTGCELWRSDATNAGTVMVADIMTALVNAAGTQTFGSNPSELAIMSNVVYFRAASSVITVGTSNITSDYELWKSDGLAANTVRVVDVEPGIGNGMPTYVTPMQTLNGPKLVFAATQGATGQEIYFTNGAVGDLASRDIYPNTTGSYPGPFVPMGNRTYFAATDPTNGTELWATDGTPAGTYLVKDIYSGTLGSSPGLLTAAGNFLYFRASDASGTGLWRSDGTANGTTKIFGTFTPISASLFQIAAIGNATNSGRVFMATAGSGTQELWVTDGTTAGTYQTCPDRTQPCGVPFASNPSDMTYIGGRMYFNATALPTVGGSLGAEPFVYP